MILTVKQTLALDYLQDKKTTELLFGGGVAGGKSSIGCYWIIKSALKYPGTRWLIGRSIFKTLRETTQKTFLEILKMQGLTNNIHYNFNQSNNTITFYNDSEVLFKDLFKYPSDPEFDELGSLELTGAFVDECNQVVEKLWEVLKSRIRFKIDKYDLVPKLLGTCNPSRNWVFRRFYEKFISNNLPQHAQFVQSLIQDNPHISKNYIKNLQTLDNVTKQRLLFGNWNYDEQPNMLMSYDNIDDAYTNNHVLNGQKAITCDIAMMGSDKFVLIVWSGLIVIEIVTLNKSDGPTVEKTIKQKAQEHEVPRSRVIFDSDGVGDFIGGYLKGAKPFRGGGKTRGIDKNEYFNIKAQCGYGIAKKFSENRIYIKDENYRDEITEELSQLQSYKIDDDQKLKIMPKINIKQNIGRSPDFLDCFIMREALELTQVTKVKFIY